MLIAKAIEITNDLLHARRAMAEPDVWDALKLLIEAGKRIDRQRHNLIPIHQPPLPGETMF